MSESGAAYVILENRGLITVGGKDRSDFLQGLISNDIRHVTAERSIWAALLTPQGKYLHDFFVSEFDGAYLIDCEAARLMDLGQRLSRYKLRAAIDLGMSEAHCVAAVYGDGAAAAFGLSGERGVAAAFGGGIAYRDPRHAALGVRAVLDKEKADMLLAEAGIAKGRFEDYEAIRLALAAPDGSRDMVIDKSILLESNFDELNGVDWQKGCFIGQELTARTKYRGLIKKRLVPVEIDGEAPPVGAVISFDADGREAGEMRSSADGVGLALLRLEYLDRVLAGEGGLSAGASAIRPHKPDWAAY
jgi:folate-binding protein YgfZ